MSLSRLVAARPGIPDPSTLCRFDDDERWPDPSRGPKFRIPGVLKMLIGLCELKLDGRPVGSILYGCRRDIVPASHDKIQKKKSSTVAMISNLHVKRQYVLTNSLQ